MASHPPPTVADDSIAEFTFRAIAAGVLFGVVFGAANAYLGLRVGLTVSTSIPIAVLTVALFRIVFARSGGGTILVELKVGAVHPLGQGRLALSYRYPRGSGAWIHRRSWRAPPG